MWSIYCRPRNHVIISLLLVLFFVSSLHAYSLDPLIAAKSQDAATLSERDGALDRRDLAPRALDQSIPLRILCLGASITYGWLSSDGNGYRYALRGKLVAQGNAVNMVGGVSAGNMSNNKVEAWPGYRIDQIAAKGNLSLPLMPNVVLVFMGTNDMSQSYHVNTTQTRLGNLLNHVFNAVPGVTVIVGTLLPNANAVTEANIRAFNAALPGLVSNFTAQGKKISMVDFHSNWFSTADLRSDGTHPTDKGYLKMARVWYKGIVAAADNITAPAVVQGVNDFKAGNDTVTAGTAMNAVCQGQSSGNGQTQCSAASKVGVLNFGFVLLGLLLAWC